MIEVEVKAAAAREPLARQLRAAGAAFERRVGQADVYYNAPHRDFAATDEAVRLRAEGDQAFLTYKGPKLDPQSKARKEVEVEVGAFARAEDILLSLGFRRTLEVRKERDVYRFQGASICLDRVEGLGDFVEAEAWADDEAGIGARRDELIALLRGLGVGGPLIRESYLELLLKKAGQ